MIRRPLLTACTLFFLLGCETPFNPKGPYQEKMVVYSVLSTDSDTVFARVYRTYNPTGFDPYEVSTDQPVTDAVVRLTTGASAWIFGDTLVERADSSRYQSPIFTYMLTGVNMVPGAEYHLEVQSPTAGTVDAIVTLPAFGSLTVQNAFILQNPTLTANNVTVTIGISSATWGYYLRLYLIGELWEGGAWRPFKREVPMSVEEIIDCQNFYGEFPRMQRRETTTSYEEHIMMFENVGYRWAIASVRSGRETDSVRFLRAEFEFLETDRALYSYYNVASGFRDEFTLRTDEPDYTNIRGGRGVFGAFVRQRVSYSVPSNLGSTLSCE
jgi:hypothetical protein